MDRRGYHMTQNKPTRETQKVEKLLRAEFPRTDSYRHNSASIRVRIIDERFEGLNEVEREKLVLPFIKRLDKETQKDLIFLLLLTPDEEKEGTYLNWEFINPRESML
jgi:stress-induced morphogen